MDDLITSRYHLTGRDFFELCVAHHRHTWRRSPILGVGRVAFVLLLLALLAGWTVKQGAAAFDPSRIARELLGPLALLGAVGYLFHPKNILNRLWYGHHYRSMAEANWSIEWGFEPERLWARTELAESSYRWEMFESIVEMPGCFLFYSRGRHLALWLPAHAFSSPGMLRAFTDLARSKAPNYVGLGECRFPAKPDSIGLDEL